MRDKKDGKGRFQSLKTISFLIEHFVSACIITAMIAFFLKGQDIKIQRIEFVLNAIITCSSTLVGFMLTSLSIIFGLVNTALLRTIYKTNARYELNIRYVETMLIGVILIIACIITGAMTNCDLIVPFLPLIFTIFFAILFLIGFIFNGINLVEIIMYAPTTDEQFKRDKPSTPKGEFRI